MNKANRPQVHKSKKISDLLNKAGPEAQKRVDNRMLLAAKLDDALKAKGWTQSKLAKEMGKTPSEISKWLSGMHNFTSETLWDIEEKLGIQIIILSEKAATVTKVAEYRTTVMSEFKRNIMAGLGDRIYLPASSGEKQKKAVPGKPVKYA